MAKYKQGYDEPEQKCYSCGEMTKTLANMEKTIANVATIETNMVTMETQLGNLETSIADIKTDMEGKFEAVNNDVRGLKTALIEGFDEMKDVLIKMEDRMKENTRKVRNTPSGDKENIIVAGGEQDESNDSVEFLNWSQKSWALLQSIPDARQGANSFVYNNHVMIAGGSCVGSGFLDDMIQMNIDPKADLSNHWSDCPVKLPAKLMYHSTVLNNDQLYVIGGCIERLTNTSDCIHEVQLAPPYTVKTLSRLPEPSQGHSTEIFDDNLLIVGGRTTTRFRDSVSSVVLYDIKKNECKQLTPLPYEVSGMATVRWGDNIVVIGGIDKDGNVLDTVIMYNVKTEQSHMLPPMIYKRCGCTAVVIQNNIVVLGGMEGCDEEGLELKSVEAFNFESYHWEELPEMSQERCFHTAVVV